MSDNGKEPNGSHLGSLVKREDWAPVFLGCVTEGMTVMDAACAADIHVSRAYQRRRSDKLFATAWREAAYIGTKLLEEEAARRAYHGVLEPVFYKGDHCGTVRKYSDTLLIFLLKAKNPKKYRDMMEQGKGTPIQVNLFNDIRRDIELIEAERPADSNIPPDCLAQPVDAPQANRAQKESEAD